MSLDLCTGYENLALSMKVLLQANQPNMAMTMLAQAVQHAQSSGLTGQNNNPLAQLGEFSRPV